MARTIGVGRDDGLGPWDKGVVGFNLGRGEGVRATRARRLVSGPAPTETGRLITAPQCRGLGGARLAVGGGAWREVGETVRRRGAGNADRAQRCGVVDPVINQWGKR